MSFRGYHQLRFSKTGSITDTIPVRWNLEYAGIAQATETHGCPHDNGPWILFSKRANTDPGDIKEYGQLDVRKLPRGGYRIKSPRVFSRCHS